MREALALLSPLHREALIKREIEEKPLPQIAEELDIPVEQVKHVLHRARRSLRRLLVGTHVEPGVDLDLAMVLAANRERAARVAKPVGASVVALLAAPRQRARPARDQAPPQVTEIAATSANPSLGLGPEAPPAAQPAPPAVVPQTPAETHQTPVTPRRTRTFRRTPAVVPGSAVSPVVPRAPQGAAPVAEPVKPAAKPVKPPVAPAPAASVTTASTATSVRRARCTSATRSWPARQTASRR